MLLNKKAMLASLTSATLMLTTACTSSNTASTQIPSQCRPIQLTKGVVPANRTVPTEQDILNWISYSTSIPVENLQLDKLFVDDLGLDSLDMVELVITVEDNWGRVIPDAEVEKLIRVGDVVNYIQANP